jgi:hypothetical protein
VNPGGEPGRDDNGLPPVGIEIPDDARELDRDVQAYYRELRAQRRQQRGLRLRGSLARDGIILPLLACCLILALITGTLLTVFTATSDQNRINTAGNVKPTASPHSSSRAPSGGATSSAPAATATPPPTPAVPATVPGRLPPGATITVGGQPLPVQQLTRAALVLIPAHCNCTSTVESLIYVATGADAQAYLVYTADTKSDVLKLYTSLSGRYQAEALLAYEPDSDHALRESIPAMLYEEGLAAILIGPTKHALYATGLRPQDDVTTLIQALTH